MNKVFSIMLMLLVMSISMVSCSDSDNDNAPTSGIVGTWRCNNHMYWGPDTYTFNGDGTYYWECPGYSGSPEIGTYSYNEDTGLFIRVNSNGTSWWELITLVSADKFILTDEDGDSYTYLRLK